MECLFCKIIEGKIPANILYQDEKVLAFSDINPQAPTHAIIIPKTHISTLNDVSDPQYSLVGHMVKTATDLAKSSDLAEKGYRVVLNCNGDGGQSVYHIHLHLLGGRMMMWPPG